MIELPWWLFTMTIALQSAGMYMLGVCAENRRIVRELRQHMAANKLRQAEGLADLREKIASYKSKSLPEFDRRDPLSLN